MNSSEKVENKITRRKFVKETVFSGAAALAIGAGGVALPMSAKANQKRDTKDLEARLAALENEVKILKDVEEIKRLQRAYGYYLEHWMYEDIIDLFSDDPGVVLMLGSGTYLGKNGVRRYFSALKEAYDNPEFLHQVMQLSGIVDIEPNGNTAKGRWYGFGALAIPERQGVRQMYMSGTYTCEYIKDDGKWSIWKLVWSPLYMAHIRDGWVKPERLSSTGPFNQLNVTNVSKLQPDKPSRNMKLKYPSGYIRPFHFKHPVTGEATRERVHNKDLGIQEES
jgi:hypothetical protein